MPIPPRLVIAAGLPRSGSTWQFNVIRQLLALDTGQPVYGAWINDYDPANSNPVHVVKLHSASDMVNFDSEIPRLTCLRDIRAVVGSMVRMRWLGNTYPAIRAYCRSYIDEAALVLPQAAYVMRYERMMAQPEETCREMATILGAKASKKMLKAVVAAVNDMAAPIATPDGTYANYERDTGLHPGHIGDQHDAAAIARLPRGALRKIEAEFAPWLAIHGYPARLQLS